MPALHALCCGRLSFDRTVFFPDAAAGERTTVPVPGFLVIHPKGKLLFDTGIDCVRDDALPALETMPGFVGLSLLVDRESGRCIATSAWDSQDAMRASGETVRPIREHATAAFGGESSVDEWQIAAVHRDHRAGEGARVRTTWLQVRPDRFSQALDFYTSSVLPAIENLDGFCSASVMAQPTSRRAVISATYDSGEVLDRNRDAARSLRTTRLRDLGAEQIDVGEFELAIAGLQVPEMV